jgi:hypothetical protein
MTTVNLTLQVGQSTVLKANIMNPSSALIPPRQVVWKTSMAHVVTINPDTEIGNECTIGARGVGLATVSCTSEGVTSTVVVTVQSTPVDSITFSIGPIQSNQ